MSRKGFTLIELLIVIAILGILVALILPRFSDVRDDANVKVCIANIRGLVSAMNTYAVRENQGSGFTWGAGNDVAFLETAGYLANEPLCPKGDGSSYVLSGNGDDPVCSCPVVLTETDHVWPAP